MTRRNGLVWGGGLVLLLLVGCNDLDRRNWYDTNFMLALFDNSHDRVVAGSLETVADSTQETLRQFGMLVERSHSGDDIRISATGANQRLTLVLSRQKTEAGELTHVHFDWTGDRDENLETQIVQQIEVRSKS